MVLRRSLLLATVGLTAAGMLLLAGAAVLVLRSYLIEQIDAELVDGAGRVRERYQDVRAGQARGAQSEPQITAGAGHVIEVVSRAGAGTVRVSDPLALVLLEQADLDRAKPQDVAGYRVVVVRDPESTVLVAQSLEPVDASMYRLATYLLTTSLLVLALLTLSAREVLARRLRPLGVIAAAGADLTSRAAGAPSGSPAAAADTRARVAWRAPVDLGALVRDVVLEAAAADPARPLSLDTPAVCIVTGDGGALRQALAELLVNVRDHTPPAAPARVTLAVEPGLARILVTGGGPDPAVAAQAFERYRRAGSAPAAAGGAGPGLAYVAEVAQAHGGSAGTTGPAVWFTVPIPTPARTPTPDP